MRIELKIGCDRYDPRYAKVDDDSKVVDDAQGWVQDQAKSDQSYVV